MSLFEKIYLFNNNFRPCDIFLSVSILDVTVTSPSKLCFISNAVKKCGLYFSATGDRTYEQYGTQKYSEAGIQFFPLQFDTFEGYFESVRKNLKRIAFLVGNIILQPDGWSLSSSRLALPVFTRLAIRGTAIMLFASDERY